MIKIWGNSCRRGTILLGVGFVILVANAACSFQQSVEKDLSTGAYSRGDGIGVDEVHIQSIGQRQVENEFVYGETVNFVFDGVRGFAEENDRVFPGMSLQIISNEQDTVLGYPDLFADMRTGTDLSPLQMQAHFTAALPYQTEDNYKVYIRIWDKRGEGTYTYELPFGVVESPLLDIQSTGINYASTYLWNADRKEVEQDSIVNQNDSLVLIIEGTNGFVEEEDMVYPELSVELTDQNGDKLLSDSNMLSAYGKTGIPSTDMTHEDLHVTLSFTDGQIHNPCTLTVILNDQKSDKRLVISRGLVIQ